jgi:hypothetical protein
VINIKTFFIQLYFRYGKGQIKIGRNYRLTRPTLSVLSDDTFISACEEFVNLCEVILWPGMLSEGYPGLQ